MQLSNLAEGEVLKCPICNEAHQIPANGAHGFRKDFRINSFLDMTKRKEQLSVKIVFCKKHPELELSHMCRQEGCNRALLCAQCVKENHVNHAVHPVNKIRNSKLTTLGNNRKVITKNLQLLKDVKKKLEKNKKDTKDEVSKRMKTIQITLAQRERKVKEDIDRKTTEQIVLIDKEENALRLMHSQSEVLEMELSDSISSIMKGMQINI